MVGNVTVNTYTGNDGVTRASLEVNADEVEFLSPRGEVQDGGSSAAAGVPGGQSSGFVKVDDEELPF